MQDFGQASQEGGEGQARDVEEPWMQECLQKDV